jgi:type IV pilus assembly protein PilQ
VIKPSTTRVLSGLLALGVGSIVLNLVVLAPSALSRTTSAVELRLRRSLGRVDVVIAGLSTKVRAVSQNRSDGRWSARLTGVDLGERPFTPQQMLLPSSELLSVRLEPLDGDLQLIVKARMGERLPTPTIGSNGKSLVVSFAGLTGLDVRSSGRLDLRRPGRVAQPEIVPPMRPRAVAPPLGDMAVGTMLINNRSFVQASGPPVSLTLKNAPAKDALMSLARLGGYGFVFVDGADVLTAADIPTGEIADSSQYPVTMAFRNERYDRALNSVLMASGLQGRLDGNTLLVGTAVSAKSFGPQMSKVFRMNQVDVASASQYLGNLGALIAVAKTSGFAESSASGGSVGSQSASSSGATDSGAVDAETYSSGVGPLLGLTGSTDSRLNTITLVGEPKLISVAEGYLKQIDLRKRQVAVKVQILNVDLTNDKSIDSSFSARIGDTFIVSESGRAYMNFGDFKPGTSAGTGMFDGSDYNAPGRYSSQAEGDSAESGAAASQDLGSFDYPSNSFYGYLDSVIETSSAKTLAQPTLLVQEGQEAEVQTGTSVITSVSTTDTSSGSTQFEYQRENAGLNLKVQVSKIDDNGFISLSVNPEISVPISAGQTNGVDIFNISGRSLSSGSIRLRDRQTLVLTGVIQEQDTETARKWPLLGDMPLIGQFFRRSGSSRVKNELVILVTPAIVDDDAGGSYGYWPDTSEGRDLLRSSF